MQNEKDPLLLDHEIDGIRELDNTLPKWWLYLFYITIVYGVVYMLYFHVLGMGNLSAAAYEEEMANAPAREVPAVVANNADMAPVLDEATLAQGKTIFMEKCLACHGAEGQGLIGPNMTDDYYIHGPEFKDSVMTVVRGVPEKGMISWRPLLKMDEIVAVSSYIWTLRGTDPQNPKPPQGEHYPPE